LPRLRGTPLARPALLPWILGVQVASLILRFLSQPLLVATGWLLWKILFILSGVLEALALPAIFLLLLQTVLHKQTAKNALEGVRSIAPFILGAFLSLSLAAILNLLNYVSALSSSGLISATGDEANIALGLFGFLVPVALAMSSRMLPLYAHIQPFPTQLLRILALAYFGGIIFWLSGLFLPGMLFVFLNALGLLLIGMMVLILFRSFWSDRAGARPLPDNKSLARFVEKRGTETRALLPADQGTLLALKGEAPVALARWAGREWGILASTLARPVPLPLARV